MHAALVCVGELEVQPKGGCAGQTVQMQAYALPKMVIDCSQRSQAKQQHLGCQHNTGCAGEHEGCLLHLAGPPVSERVMLT